MAKVFGVAHWAHQPFLLSLMGLTPKPPKGGEEKWIWKKFPNF